MKSWYRNFVNLTWLYRFYWKYSKEYVMVSLFFWAILLPLSRILFVVFPQKVIEGLNNQYTLGQMALLVIIFQGIICLIPLLEDIYRFYFGDRCKAKVDIGIKREVYEYVLKTDYCYIDDPRYYDKYTWAVEQQASKATESLDLINNIISAITVIFSMSSIILTHNWYIVLILIISMIIRSIGYAKYYDYEEKRQEEIMPCDRKRNYINRIFYQREYSADLKSTHLSKFLFQLYDHESAKKINIINSYIRKLMGWSMFSNLIYRVLYAIVVLMIVHDIILGNIIGAATYLTIILAVEQMDNYLMTLFNLLQKGNQLGMYAENIRAFYKIESHIENQNQNEGIIEKASGAYVVDLNHVSFTYDGEKEILRDLDLHIRAGEKIAIVGENGVGKSTLVKLLLRFYDPTKGNIQINNIDLKNYNIDSLRNKIGVAFQNPNIYALSIAQNIELYESKSEDELKRTLRDVGLSKIFENHSVEQPITKEFSEKGIMLSGGEIQKMGLARIMVGDFGLLLLDEPSSALDPIAEYEMTQQILNTSNRATTIVIAHRLSTIRDFDRIVLVADGTIQEMGNHEALMKLNGKYCEMFNKQAENYIR